MSEKKKKKTLVGVLASHDSPTQNDALAAVFDKAYRDVDIRKLLKEFCFVITGGTYGRLFEGKIADGAKGAHDVDDEIKGFLHEECGIIRLPPTNKGGVAMLSYLIVQRKLNIIWPFLSPITAHLLFPENLSLLRLADLWRVKKLMNTGSLEEWLHIEAERDINLNKQPLPFKTTFPGSGMELEYKEYSEDSTQGHSVSVFYPEEWSPPNFVKARENDQVDAELGKAVIALISHDAMKDRMVDFVSDYEHELANFKSIVTTGTTGKIIKEASPILEEKVQRYHSGPKGGDIEIATEILQGGCHVVIFFVDPLHPHPHIEDVRVVFGACMINNQVHMLSNEIQARDWMDSVVRGR